MESQLNQLERVTVSVLLEKGAQQLAIVQTGVASSKLCFRPIMQRINECDSSKIFGGENNCQVTEVDYKLLEPAMLNTIRYFTESAMESLREEILAEGTTYSLQEILELEHKCRDEGVQLTDETYKFSREVASKDQQIKEISSKTCEEINKKGIQLAILQDELLDLQYHKEVSLGYMDHRIGAKLSQVSLWLQDLDHSLTQSIEFNIIACDLQDRVHLEILNYLDCVIQDLKALVEHWGERNSSEMAEMNKRLGTLQQKRLEQSQQLQSLTFLYKKHSDEMKAYLEERKAREHKEEMQQHINEMATKIQAWWRGTMVRRHLGPYKIDKKKKPKEKPKKKK